jgi:tetratricopeptide (TPR) repeat protein
MTSGLRVLGLCVCVSAGCHAASVNPPRTAAAAVKPAAPPQATRFASPYTYEWFIRAELFRASGKLDAAIDAYRAALAGADEAPEVMARLATALDEQPDGDAHQRALELLDDALALAPESEAVWLARGEVFAHANQLDQAYDAYEHAEYAAPGSARAPLALAALLRAHGHTERAAAVLLRFRARVLPGSADAHAAELAQALATGSSERVFAATLPYRLGRSSQPPMAAESLLDAAQLLIEQQQPELALQVLDAAPHSPRMRSLRLKASVEVGSLAALEAWLTVNEPADSEERALTARAQLLLGQPEAAANTLEAEQLLHPNQPSLQLTAADIELARGHYAHAAELYARVPASSSAGGAARQGLGRALSALGLSPLAAELSQ